VMRIRCGLRGCVGRRALGLRGTAPNQQEKQTKSATAATINSHENSPTSIERWRKRSNAKAALRAKSGPLWESRHILKAGRKAFHRRVRGGTAAKIAEKSKIHSEACIGPPPISSVVRGSLWIRPKTTSPTFDHTTRSSVLTSS